MPKKNFQLKNISEPFLAFSEAKIRYESGRVPFDQMEVFEKMMKAKKSFIKVCLSIDKQAENGQSRRHI